VCRLLGLVTLLALPASCSGGSAATTAPLGPADVQRFLAVKEATDNLTRVVQLIATADATAAQLETQRPGSPAVGALLAGLRLGWNNAAVGANAFTPAQVAAVPGLTQLVLTTKSLSTAWQNAIDALGPNPAPASFATAFARPRKLELTNRALLRKTAGTLTRMACSLERSHPQLMAAGAAATDCAAASALAAGS
jgi:hypothetical protein